MRSTRRLKGAILGGLGILLAGCPDMPDGPRYQGAGKTTPQRGGTLMLSESSRVRTLDPHVAFDQISGTVIEMLFDGLYTYDQQTNVTPALAAALPKIAEDGKTLTVPLRKGARFQNGREVTAEDVVWSLERMLNPATHSPGAEYFSALSGYEEYRAGKAPHVAGLRAVDRYTVELRLSRADQSFVHILSMRFAVPVPREEVERSGVKFSERPVGTGAFRLASWDPGVRLVLERNPTYYRKGLPYLDRVVFEEGIDTETAFLRFRNGEQDVISRMSSANRTALTALPKWKPYIQSSPSVDVWGLAMNCELPPFDNVHVRRAVAFALDRERWVRARSGALRATGQMVPPQLKGYDPKLPSVQHFDLEQARKEMRLAGYPDGYSKPVTFWSNDGATAVLYGQLAQADLEKIGIHLELKLVSFPVYLEETGKRKTAQMAMTGWSMDYPDPSNFLGLVHSRMSADRESVNRAFYSNPVVDDLLDRGLVERDPVKRVELYHQANELVAHDAPWAFFGNQQVPQGWQPYVKNYVPHPVYWIPVNDVWLDLPKKRADQLAATLSPFDAVKLALGGSR